MRDEEQCRHHAKGGAQRSGPHVHGNAYSAWEATRSVARDTGRAMSQERTTAAVATLPSTWPPRTSSSRSRWSTSRDPQGTRAGGGGVRRPARGIRFVDSSRSTSPKAAIRSWSRSITGFDRLRICWHAARRTGNRVSDRPDGVWQLPSMGAGHSGQVRLVHAPCAYCAPGRSPGANLSVREIPIASCPWLEGSTPRPRSS
jgi:hypothetical protein